MEVTIVIICFNDTNRLESASVHRALGGRGGLVSASGPEGPRPEIRFYRRSAVYMGPLHAKSYVGGVVRKLGERSACSGVVLIIRPRPKFTRCVPK
ncbi:hypothetical protein AVEN_222872-1 [Araneus ventricosus]|uniref:Uncharacterized protein n=1 Tax=Araneus ventricosus TaxID=182803 RepID=A0A4Y2T4U1_ARAVE|nr:hypothetical protein AVEN_222872-1 [Araneus ventricosus]